MLFFLSLLIFWSPHVFFCFRFQSFGWTCTGQDSPLRLDWLGFRNSQKVTNDKCYWNQNPTKSLPWPEHQNLFLVGHSPLGWGRSIRFFQASLAMMSWQELGNAKVLMPEKTIPWGVTHFLGAMGVFLLKHSTSRFTIDISSTMVKVSWDSR